MAVIFCFGGVGGGGGGGEGDAGIELKLVRTAKKIIIIIFKNYGLATPLAPKITSMKRKNLTAGAGLFHWAYICCVLPTTTWW